MALRPLGPRPRGAESPPADPLARALASRAALHGRMLAWFAAAARDLPWRRTRDPYGIWISEAMLQQTRVGAVLGYWQRFLDRFPNPAALAEASDEALLGAWSGLGYYRRARALREAAVRMVRDHGGQVPGTREAFLALPGVGPYTAGAVLSIAFGRAEPLVDGNVARVFARWFRLGGDPTSGASQRLLWALAEALLPREEAGTWNQALMELGATVCTPKSPDCPACPVRDLCAAWAEGEPTRYPSPKVRRAPVEVQLELAVVRREGRILLERRAEGRLLAGLWQLPTRQLAPVGGGATLFPPTYSLLGLEPKGGAPLAQLAHAITHHRIRATLVAGALETPPDGEGWMWFGGPLSGAALTGLARKALSALGRSRRP